MSESPNGRHELGVEVPIGAVSGDNIVSADVQVEATLVQTVPNTVINQIRYYGKALGGAVISGLLYFLTVLTPAATLGDITLLQWIGFWVTVLGTGLGVGTISNGAKPTR